MNDPTKPAVKVEMKRRDCRHCLFLDRHTRRCIPGIRRCFLNNIRKNDSAGSFPCRKQQGCSVCPYGFGRPCVSFCMREILKEWRAVKVDAGKEVRIYA